MWKSIVVNVSDVEHVLDDFLTWSLGQPQNQPSDGSTSWHAVIKFVMASFLWSTFFKKLLVCDDVTHSKCHIATLCVCQCVIGHSQHLPNTLPTPFQHWSLREHQHTYLNNKQIKFCLSLINKWLLQSWRQFNSSKANVLLFYRNMFIITKH